MNKVTKSQGKYLKNTFSHSQNFMVKNWLKNLEFTYKINNFDVKKYGDKINPQFRSASN